MEDKIQKIFNKVLNEKNSFGASLRIENGQDELIFNNAGGNINLESQYYIASTTKLFTTAIIYKLMDEGKVSLDDNLLIFFNREIVKGLNIYNGQDFSDSITVKQLLSHTSGIPDYFSGKTSNGKSLEEKLLKGEDEKWDFEKSLNLAKDQKSKFYPGKKGKALYSDTNFQILGRIIEIIRQRKIEDVFKEEIFDYLKLQNTYCFTNSLGQDPISLYYKERELEIPLAMSSFGADGGIVSTSEDMMIFLKAFIKGKLFSMKNIEIMESEYNRIFFPLQYGVGIMMFQLPIFFTLFRKFPPLIGHSGLSGAFAFYCREKDIYMTGTVNQLAAKSRSYQMMIKALQVLK